MKTELISDWEALGSLEPEWNALLRRSRANSVFCTWEWVSAWRHIAGGAHEPLVVVARDASGALAGVAPFYTTRLRLGNVLPYRTLRILGDHPTGHDYGDWIVAREREAEVAAALTAALAAPPARDRWECIWIPNVAGWTGAFERIAGACAAAGLHVHRRDRIFSAFEMPSSGKLEDYLVRLNSAMRRQVKSDRRKFFAREGARFLALERSEDLGPAIDALFDLHRRRWEARGEEGAFRRKPLEAEFYRRFAPVARDRGWLRIYGLEVGGEMKAVNIGYVYEGVYNSLQSGFDPSYDLRTGSILHHEMVEALLAEGVKAFDFLGGYAEHKRRWRAVERPGHDLFIGRRTLKNRLLFTAAVWPTGRYLRPAGSERDRPAREAPADRVIDR